MTNIYRNLLEFIERIHTRYVMQQAALPAPSVPEGLKVGSKKRKAATEKSKRSPEQRYLEQW